jgi:asparagine synthase (glutamine-hydrolysing)
MAFGIESRVPFADDVDLVDYLFSIQGSEKIKQGVSKYLLREASKNYIPKQIYARRDKIGFETPVQKWFSPHKSQILDVLGSQLDVLNMKHLVSNFEELLKFKPNFIVRLYSLAIWKKTYSDI